MSKLCDIKKCLIDMVVCQMDNISQVDTKELGEVIDMIKDIEQTMYYHTIIEAMEKSENHIADLPFVAEEEKKKGEH